MSAATKASVTLADFKRWVQARQDDALQSLREKLDDETAALWKKFSTTATVILEIERFADELEKAAQ